MNLRAFLALVATLTTLGCLDGFNPDDSGTQPNVTDDGGVTTQGVIDDFNTKLAPLLSGADGKSGACGACHGIAGGAAPAFLLPMPDLYTTVTRYPSLIGSAPETSRLYAKGVHAGPALTVLEGPVVAAWILEYDANQLAHMDGGAVRPTLAPFAPVLNAVNRIDLALFDPRLAGQSVTFSAALLGSSSLELTQLEVHTAQKTGVHLVHPLWVTWDERSNATPDPVDSFSNLDQTVYGSASAAIGPGTLILPDWSRGSRLSVAFVRLEPKMGGADGGSVAGCQALPSFVANVKPLLSASCNACHVGATPTAGLSFDFGANSDATVCANARAQINPATPADSLLLQRPNPASSDGHPRKIGDYGLYRAAVSSWIDSEK